MTKYKIQAVFAIALLGGFLTAIGYVNPYNGKILLSELVLQISGSRGELALGFSMPELLTLVMRMIPCYIFEIYIGTALYRHFCTASVYVFSRCPRRVHWYLGESLIIGAAACVYQAVLLFTVVFVTKLRYEFEVDGAGTVLLVYHFLIYTIWIYAVTLMVNLLAVFIGSSSSFLTVVSVQIICITMLGCGETFQKYVKDAPGQEALLKLNPIAHLVLGWHNSDINEVDQVLNPPYPGLDLNSSLLYITIFCAIILYLGAFIIKRHNLLTIDSEVG